MSRRRRLLAPALVALATLAWTLDRHATVREGNRLFAAGEYAAAEAKYNEALVDAPDSSLLHFNRGDAAYEQGKLEEAVAAFERAQAGDAGDARRAHAAYNAGNARFRLGQAAAAENPKAALDLYADALVQYRRALAADPEDRDAKFNYELVRKTIDELHERMQREQEEKEQEQEQGEQEQEEQREQGEPQEQGEQPQEQEGEREDQQPQGQEEQPEETGEQQQQQQAQPDEPPEDEGGGGAPEQAGGELSEEELSAREAGALLDSLREEEVRPEEMVERLQGGVVAEPARDW